MRLIIIVIFQFLTAQIVTGQIINNPKFDQKLRETIDFNVPTISVRQAYDQFSNFTFLDSREKVEYETSHIAGARFVGYKNFTIESVIDLPKNSDIIVYCSIGYRSDLIGKQLREAGFKNVNNLYGSIFEWVNQGYEVVDKSGIATDNIHTYNKKWSQWVDHPDIKKIW